MQDADDIQYILLSTDNVCLSNQQISEAVNTLVAIREGIVSAKSLWQQQHPDLTRQLLIQVKAKARDSRIVLRQRLFGNSLSAPAKVK